MQSLPQKNAACPFLGLGKHYTAVLSARSSAGFVVN